MTNDFGRDIILRKDGKKIFVECKCYDWDNLVGRPSLQKFYGAMVSEKADGGIFVTTSDFTNTAKEFAKGTNLIELINGATLASLMCRAFPEDSDENEYRVMCRECRQAVVFDLRKNVAEARCQNGHLIKNDFSTDSLDKLISENPYFRISKNSVR